MTLDLSAAEIERAKFAYSIYDFEGNGMLDGFYLESALRAVGMTPTVQTVQDKFGGQKKRGVKKFSIDEFLTAFSEAKKDKEVGNAADFLEILKLYDKSENGTMIFDELRHILCNMGEKLEVEEVAEIIKDCADPPDEDGFTQYKVFVEKLMAGPQLKED